MHHHVHRRHAHPAASAIPEVEEASSPQELEERAVVTMVSVIYQTAPKTFAGPATYITPSPTTKIEAKPTPTPKVDEKKSSSTSVKKTPTPTTSEEPEETETESSTSAGEETPATTPFASVPVASAGPAISATPSPTIAPSAGGMSGGAKAGLALGILFGIGAILALVLLCYRKKKREQKNPDHSDNEKGTYEKQFSAASVAPVAANSTPAAAPMSSAASIKTARTMSTAPRLSLRPVTQFDPMIGDKRKSNANKLGLAAAAVQSQQNSRQMQTPSPVSPPSSSWERRPSTANAANDPANPFGNHAERVEPVVSALSTPIANAAVPVRPTPAQAQAAELHGAGITSGPAAPAPTTALPAPPSIRSNIPSLPPSPAPTGVTELPASPVLSTPTLVGTPTQGPAEVQGDMPATPSTIASAAGAAGAAAAVVAGAATSGRTSPPGPAGPLNVHRVQLDFRPSMQDELELRAGQLVRLLHEYDDGWALCIRMDRSQQGVVPRTCLSRHPVKPRAPPPNRPPQNGPPRRGPPPMGSAMNSPVPGMGSPMGTPMGTPMGPNFVPRPLTPTSGRNSPMNGPPPAGRSRANSSAQLQQRSMSPGPYGGSQQPPRIPQDRRRSNSMSQLQARSVSPPNPSPLSKVPQRKPVPGQAM